MRRLLVAAMAAWCAFGFSDAYGKAAVIDMPHPNETASAVSVFRADNQTSRQSAMEYVRAFLDAHGASYDVIPARQVQTSLIKDGVVNGWNGGSAYQAVIWVGMGNILSTNPVPGCWPCSLSAAASMYPSVPQLFLGTTPSEVEISATACGTPISDSQDPASQGPSYSKQRVYITGDRDVFGWVVGVQGSTNRLEVDTTATTFVGGLRVVMGANSSNMMAEDVNDRPADKRPAWRDSIFDTTWENRTRINGGMFGRFDAKGTYLYDMYKPGAGAIIVGAHWLATAIPTTGGDSGNNDLRPRGNPFVIWAAIAHLDSISGFGVFGTSPKKRAIAFQVSHGLSRGAWNAPGGVRPDETNLAAAVDSLAALNIPFAVGIPASPDTIATYASDLAIWQRASRVKFALSDWTGVNDTTVAGLGGSSTTKPIDIFGRFRSRLFYTPGTTDTSVYALLRASRARLDSLVGASKVDLMLMAGNDDWSPRNWPFPSNSRDSLAGVARLAGFSGIANNADDDSLDTVTPTNPLGMNARQTWTRASIGSAAGERFLFATFPGFNPRGAVFGNGGGNANVLDDSCWVQIYAHRAIRGLYLSRWHLDQKQEWVRNTRGMAVSWLGEPTQNHVSQRSTWDTGTNLVRITASSLGHGGGGPTPDMPGFYQVKYTVNMCKAINKLAGRELIRFVYPGDLTADDLRR